MNPQDLNLSWAVRHVLGCSLDEAECQQCQEVLNRKPEPVAYEPMVGYGRIGAVMSKSFHIQRVEWEHEQDLQQVQTRAKVRRMRAIHRKKNA